MLIYKKFTICFTSSVFYNPLDSHADIIFKFLLTFDNYMDVLKKVAILSDAGRFDSCASTASHRSVKTYDRIGNAAKGGICHSFSSIDGRCIALFKTLYTNHCTHDCKYCLNSGCAKKSKDVAMFKPDEFAKVFMSLYVRNYVEGLFLSSGICKDSDYTTELMLEAVKIIREKYKFAGYIHFKALPGVSRHLLKEAEKFSDRISINIEMPNKTRLNEVTSVKDYKIDILRRQRWIKYLKLPAGQTTQLVVGGCNETDKEILKMVNWQYQNMKLKRVYYSAFQPVKGTLFEHKQAVPLTRETRLFNVDWLVRVYDYKMQEIYKILDDNNNLPDEDPKIVYAKQYFDKPVDVNHAEFHDLIRVPGIGPVSATRILRLREKGKTINKRQELHNIGVVLKRAEPFIKINGYVQRTITSFT